MRPVGARKKKLIVAFHFQQANPVAWKCETCRKAGLELKRRCGWLPAAQQEPAKLVWSRRKVVVDECPKSFITAQSLTWLEEFYIMRQFWQLHLYELSARQVDAFLILENERMSEAHHGRE
jgi:hypothetical protein